MAERYFLSKSGRKLSFVGLRGACRYYQGIKGVAEKAEVPAPSLTRWLKGEPTLAVDKIERVLAAIDLPKGKFSKNIIPEWSYGVEHSDLVDAMALYFPDGAEIARTGWSRPGMKNALKYLTLAHFRGSAPPEIYLFKYKDCRAILRQPSGFLFYPEMAGKKFRWRGGDFEKAAFGLGRYVSTWMNGPVSMDVFNHGWESEYKSWEDVVNLARDKEISEEIVFRLLEGLK